MGLSPFSSCSCGEYSQPIPETVVDVRDFRIEEIYKYDNGAMVVKVNYPNCVNYEGDKVLVFKDVSEDVLRNSKTLDPHFCDNCKTSPVARFEPTERGLNWARDFAYTL
jgi:hypothetical protein